MDIPGYFAYSLPVIALVRVASRVFLPAALSAQEGGFFFNHKRTHNADV